jgi:hypothetical protein
MFIPTLPYARSTSEHCLLPSGADAAPVEIPSPGAPQDVFQQSEAARGQALQVGAGLVPSS